jgi:RNA polymerase sigma-70 factor (ECF subfamily)
VAWSVHIVELKWEESERNDKARNRMEAIRDGATPAQEVGMVERDLRLELVELLPRLRRFGIALTRSVVHADDLVQTACERALIRQDQLRHETKIGVWMYTIMRNLWIDEIRAPRSYLHDSIDAARDVVGDNGEALTEKNNAWAAVRRALDELPAEQRAALILICVNGISYKEAAKILDIPLGTVTSRVARARRALHGRLATAPAALSGDAIVRLRERFG